MLWSFTKRRINNDAVQYLKEHQNKFQFDSSAWLLHSHLKPLNASLQPDAAPLELPSVLFHGSPPVAFPFANLRKSIQQSVIFCSPPPAVRTPHIVDKKPDGSLHWRSALDHEILDASLYTQDTELSFLCSTAVEPFTLSSSTTPQSTLCVFNAQQCGNPFALDSALTHTNLLTNEEFPDAFRSGLTTIASQFGYSTFRWLLATDLQRPQVGFEVLRDQQPHAVLIEEGTALLHVSELPAEQQSRLLSAAPRFVLLEGFDKPFVLMNDKWHNPVRLGFNEKLRAKHMPKSASSSRHPLLWVAAADQPEVSAVPLLRHRSQMVRVYHASQLHHLTPPQA